MPHTLVLAGTDFSRGSEAAVRLAVAWTRAQGGALRVLHVLEGPAAALAAAQRERIEAELRDLAHRAGADDLDGGASLGLETGDAFGALAPSPDRVVVVGAEGGAASLVRRAGHVPARLATTVPAGGLALVAPPGWRAPGTEPRRREPRHREPGSAFERILVACSLTGHDAPRVERACRLASASPRSEIHLAHVVDVSAARHLPPSARAAVRDMTDDARTSTTQALRDLAADAVPLELAARRDARVHVVRQGPAARDLAGLAGSQGIDLIACGPGDVAASLAGFTPCPLLIVG